MTARSLYRKRLVWRLIGWVLFAIGLAGLVLPVLPTAGFWILAVLALQRSDPALAERIRNWPKVGKTVADFIDYGVIAPKGKLAALTAMAISAALVATFVSNQLALGGALGGIAIGALYVATRPSRPLGPPDDADDPEAAEEANREADREALDP